MARLSIYLLLFILSVVSPQKPFLDRFSQLIRKSVEATSRLLAGTPYTDRNMRWLRENKDSIGENVPFPCKTDGFRSETRPTNVNYLRPGDIDIVAAMGDSITTGIGVLGSSLTQMVASESRDTSFSAGGRGSWRNFLTLPNILRQFNPNLIGFSLDGSLTTNKNSQFNVAEIGAYSEDMPFMAKVLARRILSDKRVNATEDWKMITIFMGINNICSEACVEYDIEKILLEHKNEVISALRILRDSLPRTIINFLPPPDLSSRMEMRVNFICQAITSVMCTCLFSSKFQKDKMIPFIKQWQELDKSITQYDEFNTKDFAVIYQPFIEKPEVKILQNRWTTSTEFALDCFHLSQRGHARMANGLWNNMLEPVGRKNTFSEDTFQKFLCPTDQHPYLWTNENSKIFLNRSSSPAS